jgi:hypothetical protein
MTLVGPLIYVSEAQYTDDTMLRNCIDLISLYECKDPFSNLDNEEINFNALDRLDILYGLDAVHYITQPTTMKIEYAPLVSLLCRNDSPKLARARAYDVLI